MTRGFIGGISIALGCLSVVGAQQTPPPIFRSAVQVVTIDVSVQKQNTPVVGLTAADFEVLDNGAAQKIELQRIETMPVDVSLVFDVSAATEGFIGARFPQQLTKIAGLLHSSDRLRVVTFATDVREVVPMRPTITTGRQGADAVSPSAAGAQLRDAGRPDRRGYDFQYDPKLRHLSVFDAVLFALARPAELGHRYLVVAFSGGLDSGGILLDGALFGQVAARTDALLHFALWNQRRGPTGWKVEGLRERYSRDALASAAVATGGAAHDAADGVDAFRSVFSRFRQGYVLRYTLSGVPTGGWHSIVVTTPRFPSYEVRARKGYAGQ